VDAFAAFLRYDAPGAGRSLSRLATSVLAGKLRPAAQALAAAVDLVLAGEMQGDEMRPAADARAGRDVALNFNVSPECLLGQCRTSGSACCGSPLCEHDCHCRQFLAAGAMSRRAASLPASQSGPVAAPVAAQPGGSPAW
jgi:hypothetical protein